jgi:hypothetical protein
MSGDAPQPGETPQSEGAAEQSWWHGDSDPNRTRHPRRRPPQAGTLLPQREQPYEGETAEARTAAASDVAREIDPPLKQRPAEEPVTRRPAADGLRTEPGGTERDHNRPDAYRYDPLRPPAGYTSRLDVPEPAPPTAEQLDQRLDQQLDQQLDQPRPSSAPPMSSPGATSPQISPPPASPPRMPPLRTSPPPASRTPMSTGLELPTAPKLPTDAELSTDAGQPTAEQHPEPPAPAPEPDVMVLPEPDARNRPTVSLERSPVPGQGRLQAAEPLPHATGDPATDARLEKLENSPFWLDNPDQAGARRLPEVSSHVGKRRRVRKGVIRKPAPALLALITLALVATFFAWVSAEPFWLAVGHGDRGYATTAACNGSGVVQRCAGRFDAADGSFAVTRVALLGVADGERANGAVAPARMVSADSRMAYLGDTGLLVQLRWILGFLLVLMCGFGIASLTGARRLDDPRARRLVILGSLLAPIVLLVGFLGAAY